MEMFPLFVGLQLCLDEFYFSLQSYSCAASPLKKKYFPDFLFLFNKIQRTCTQAS